VANVEDKDVLVLVGRLVSEARTYLAKRDPVQASEKLYKAAEECVKALAGKLKLPVVEGVEKEGRWTTQYLFQAVRDLASTLGEDVRNAWNAAWTLHVEGFHEMKLPLEYVEDSAASIEKLIGLFKKATS
jgi:triphosphoribosyl-dephospho-CoA synthetase